MTCVRRALATYRCASAQNAYRRSQSCAVSNAFVHSLSLAICDLFKVLVLPRKNELPIVVQSAGATFLTKVVLMSYMGNEFHCDVINDCQKR